MITPSFSLTATERVLPKLALDFTTASLDPRVTFTRTGNTATVTNSSGYVVPINADLPRFDYDPVTLVCKGLLVEEARTNLMLQSAAFSTASWSKYSVTANLFSGIGNSPDGATNASKVVTNSGVGRSGTGIIQLLSKAAVATTYTASAYFKAGEVERVRLFTRDNASSANSADLTFNASTGAVISGPSASGTFTNASGTITNVGNGWYRATLTYTTGTETTIWGVSLLNAGSTGTGDGSGGFYIWGAQLEAGAFATSYIPTTTTALTRNADVATMTGTNFSDWFNASEGTMEVEAMTSTVTTASAALVNMYAASTNRMWLYRNLGTSATFDVTASGATSASITQSAAIAANTAFKVAGAYKLDSFALSAKGIATSTDTSGAVPTVNQLLIGNSSPGNSTANAHIRKINYWPMRLTNAEVQAFSK